MFDAMHSEYPIEQLGDILDVDADGLLPGVNLIGNDFVMTFFRLVIPFGSALPIRAPVLRVRRPLIGYQPNQLHLLIQRAQSNTSKVKLLHA